MTTIHLHDTDRAARRAEIERIIAVYPDIGDADLQDVLHYFRREASALDRATIASNGDVARQYRQLCADHYLDRLKPMETAIVAVLAAALVGGLILLALLT